MSAATLQAGKPGATRLWAVAKAVGAVIAVLPPSFAVWVSVTTPDRVVRAREVISTYQEPEYADARAYVDAQVQFVVDRLRSSAPTNCSAEREHWSTACLQARKAYQDALVKEFESMMKSPEEKKKFILLANFYMYAMNCADSGECDRAMIEKQFQKTIGLLWRQTWPYIQKAAESDIEYALWLRDYCGLADRCKIA
jgi:hypothetical protein